MQIPSNLNLSESEIMSIIDRVVNIVSPSFSFGYFDVDDIKQEAWVMAWEALPNFKPDSGSLSNFLHTHIKNRLINLQRNKLRRVDKPKGDDFEYKIQKWKRRNELKQNLAQPTSIEELDSDSDDFLIVKNHTCSSETIDLIQKHLDISMRGDLLRILEGSTVPTKRRNKLIKEIKEILIKYHDEFNEETWSGI